MVSLCGRCTAGNLKNHKGGLVKASLKSKAGTIEALSILPPLPQDPTSVFHTLCENGGRDSLLLESAGDFEFQNRT